MNMVRIIVNTVSKKFLDPKYKTFPHFTIIYFSRLKLPNRCSTETLKNAEPSFFHDALKRYS